MVRRLLRKTRRALRTLGAPFVDLYHFTKICPECADGARWLSLARMHERRRTF